MHGCMLLIPSQRMHNLFNLFYKLAAWNAADLETYTQKNIYKYQLMVWDNYNDCHGRSEEDNTHAKRD